MTLTFGAATHKGKREVNEDAVFARLVTKDMGVFAVIDGMGGKGLGDIASEITSQAIEQHLDTLIVSDNTATALDNVLQTANSRIINYGTNNEKSRGLGASITLAVAKQDSVTFAHVGNTEGYEITANNLTRLTDIHDFVHALIKAGHFASREEAQQYPHTNVLYRALGQEASVNSDIFIHKLQPNKSLLLCTSPLTHYFSKDEIRNIIVSNKSSQNVCDALIEACINTNRRYIGNISAIFVSNQTGDERGKTATDSVREHRE